MTLEQIKELTFEEVEERLSEIEIELNSADADVDSLKAELDAIESRKKEIKKAKEERDSLLKKVEDQGTEISKKEEKSMTNEEVRASHAYAEAYKNYIISGKDTECRALLTENANTGTIPVPARVEAFVRTAWEKNEIVNRISKTYFNGNLKVALEVSGEDATIHVEGNPKIDPENLVIATVELIPQTIKKLVQVSDEVLDASAEEFLDYIYDEITYRIARALAQLVLSKISQSTYTQTLTADASATTFVNAFSMLSDEAVDPVVIMNKLTWAQFKSITTQDGYQLADPFAGMTVIFDNSLPAYSTAEAASQGYAIVGDLKSGILANFPKGENVEFKFDDKTDMASDLVNILGRMPVGVEVVATGRFVRVKKG